MAILEDMVKNRQVLFTHDPDKQLFDVHIEGLGESCAVDLQDLLILVSGLDCEKRLSDEKEIIEEMKLRLFQITEETKIRMNPRFTWSGQYFPSQKP